MFVTKSIKRISSAAFASLLASVALWFLVNRDYGVFGVLGVPSILILWVGVRVALLDQDDQPTRKGHRCLTTSFPFSSSDWSSPVS